MGSESLEHGKAIISMLAKYAMAFPHAKINDGTLAVYAKALSPLSLPVIAVALTKLMQTSKYFPMVAEIYDAAADIIDYIDGTEKKSAAEAWEEVMGEVHRAFIYRKPQFSDPAIERAAKSMGWSSLCALPAEGANTARAQFIRIYMTELARSRNRDVNAKVIGMLPADKVKSLVDGTSKKMRLVEGGRQ